VIESPIISSLLFDGMINGLTPRFQGTGRVRRAHPLYPGFRGIDKETIVLR
jgi:hypothetical protein